MSVINQVLNQLEKRGAHDAVEQAMVRSVPSGRDTRKVKFALLALIVSLAVAVFFWWSFWQWWQTGKPAAAPSSSIQNKNMTVAKRAVPEAKIAPASSVAPIPGSAQLSTIGATNSAEATRSNLQLSFELSSAVLLSDKRADKKAPHRSMAVAATKPKRVVKKQAQRVAAATKVKRANFATADTSPMKQVSVAQQADGEFRKAVALMQQGRVSDAIAGYESALRLDAKHDAARQALVALLIETRRGADAEQVLQDGLNIRPEQSGLAMVLARLQVESGALSDALATLEKYLPAAEKHADYQAFYAALLQRQNRHEEAVAHYQIALKLAPNNGVWLMGYGISSQALHRNADAKEAYQHALQTQTLSPDLQTFVQGKIKGL